MESTHPAWEQVKPLLRGHQNRSAQDALFGGILTRFDGGDQVVPAEGPTGSGKSLVLAPLTRYHGARGGRVVVSTRTKSQQRTILHETFPRMKALTPNGAAVLYGRGNYICLDRLGLLNPRGLKIRGDGSRVHYPEVPDQEWATICSSSEDGCSKNCHGDAYQDAKFRVAEADVVLVNHSVLVLNQLLDGVILGKLKHDTLVVDEAHLLPDVLRESYGADVTLRRFKSTADAIAKAGWDRDTVDRAGDLFGITMATYGDDGTSWESFDEALRCWQLMKDLRQRVALDMEALKDDASREQRAASTRLSRLSQALGDLSQESEEFAAWVTLPKTRNAHPKVERRPFDVTEEAVALFESSSRTVVMSATLEPLSVKLLGVDHLETVVGPEPFDVENRRLGYILPRIARQGGAHQWLEHELVDLVKAAGVGTMVVATSNVQKERAADALRAARLRVGMQQTTDQVPHLIDGLKTGKYDVIVGVDSFGTGVDVPGDALRLVVLLGAMNPNAFANPYLRLTSEHYESQGLRPWNEMFTPMAMEKTFQAIGRLIRTPQDYGVVAFLDPRPREMGRFRGLMSPSRTTTSLDEVCAFLDGFPR